jgi:hypothetical protein
MGLSLCRSPLKSRRTPSHQEQKMGQSSVCQPEADGDLKTRQKREDCRTRVEWCTRTENFAPIVIHSLFLESVALNRDPDYGYEHVTVTVQNLISRYKLGVYTTEQAVQTRSWHRILYNLHGPESWQKPTKTCENHGEGRFSNDSTENGSDPQSIYILTKAY